MNNGPDPASPQTPQILQATADDQALQTDTSSNVTSVRTAVNPGQPELQPQSASYKPARAFPWRRIIGIALLVIGLAVAVFLVLYFGKGTKHGSTSANSYIKTQTIALTGLSQQLAASKTQQASTLTVNGQVSVTNSLILQPTAQPTSPVTGQLYYDQTGNNLAFYNGSQFLNLLGSTVNTQITNTQISNITNVFGGAGGVAATGTPGALAMFTAGSQLGDSLITQTGSTISVGGSNLQIGSSNSDHTIQIGTGAGLQNTTVGSTSDGSTTSLQGGTGNVSILTGGTSAISGDISIKTGDSSTTASGDITIDAGVGVVDGEVIEHKGFETGLDNMNAWFGNTVARTSAVAHTGNFSLAETGNAANWGVIETLPGVSVTAGHQYYFSIWVRASTTPRNIIAKAVWAGSSGVGTVSLTPVTDSTSEWTEMTALGTAPGGATSVYFEAQSTGVNGEVHYFDDMTVTDLSSAAAISSISIGSANAKRITIGNINQIGATTINGGSGINLNSGAAGVTVTAGVLNMTGSAPSSISTTVGALTLTSADTAIWGVGTANSGAGGSLTLRAGRGGTEAVNNGGDLVLQGGAPNGAGAPGSVIVKPQQDTTSTFQIQNTAGTSFLVADATNATISVTGTDTSFATLTLANAHFKTTQTTPPTIATPSNCGTAPVSAMTVGSTDVAGSFTITTGTSGASTSCDTVVTFHRPYGAAPKSILVVGKGDAGSASRQVFVSAADANGFTASFAQSSASTAAPYSFSYWVVE